VRKEKAETAIGVNGAKTEPRVHVACINEWNDVMQSKFLSINTFNRILNKYTFQ
jgi:hypothetical protein